MWAQGVGHLEAIKQHGRSCRSCARPWFVPGEIVCAVRSRSMNPMWAVSHKAFADVVQTASLSWRSRWKCYRPRGSAAYACSTSTTYQEPAWFPLFPVQLNPARMCAPTGGRVIRGYPVRGTYTTQPASPEAAAEPMFRCPGCTKWLPSSRAGCAEPTRDRSPRSIWVPISMNSPSASIVVTLAGADCFSCAYSSTRPLRHPLAIRLRALAPKHKTTSCSGHCTQAATPLIEFDEQTVKLLPGQMLTVNRGVRHRTKPIGGRSVNLTFERAATGSERLPSPQEPSAL